MRIVECELCGEEDFFYDEKEAFMEGWSRNGSEWVCPRCKIREEEGEC